MSDAPGKYEQPGTSAPAPPAVSPFQTAGMTATQTMLSRGNNVALGVWQLWQQENTAWHPNPDPPETYVQPDVRNPDGPAGS